MNEREKKFIGTHWLNILIHLKWNLEYIFNQTICLKPELYVRIRREDVKCHTNERIDVILLPKRTEKSNQRHAEEKKKKSECRWRVNSLSLLFNDREWVCEFGFAQQTGRRMEQFRTTPW